MRCHSRVLASALLCLVATTTITLSAPRPDERVTALTHSLSETEHDHGSAAPELLPILASLAQLRFEQAQLAEATELRRRAMKIAIGSYGPETVPAAEAMAALAHLYIERRDYLDAEPLTITAAGILHDRLGRSSPALAAVLADRARIALARGDVDQARQWAEQAIAIDKQLGGAPHSSRLRTLGLVLTAQRKFADSERVLRQALALDRGSGDELATARSLAALANTYLRQKHPAVALPLIEEATLIDQTCLGPAHPIIAEDFHDLGVVFLAMNRPEDAAKALHTGMDLLDHGAGRDMPTLAYIMLDLARAEHILGHDDKAQSLFTAARRILNAAEDGERDRQRQA